MITKSHFSSQFGDSLSIQSCFPVNRSTANSSVKSLEGDDVNTNIILSDDEISLNDAASQGIPYHADHAFSFGVNAFNQSNYSFQQLHSSNMTFSGQVPYFQPHQDIPNSIDFSQVDEGDATQVLNSSVWRSAYALNSQIQPAIRQLIRETDDASNIFPQAAMPQSVADTVETREKFFTVYVPLFLASLRGDWNLAREFLNLNPQAVRATITRNSETALHIAAGAKHVTFVQELVELMEPIDLEMKNNDGNTALCFAAVSGIMKIAEAMVRKNNKLPSIRGSMRATPLLMAALLGHKDMVWYLYSVTKEDDLTDEDLIGLLVAVINADLFDIALAILQHNPQLATARDGNGETALHVLARKPLALQSKSLLSTFKREPILKVLFLNLSNFIAPDLRFSKLMQNEALELVEQLWKHVLLLDDSKIGELIRKPSRLLFTAAELGNFEFIFVLIQMYPSLIWKADNHSRSIFHIAVLHRQEKIFNLIHEIGAHKDLIVAYKDEYNNNILHLAGKLAPPDRLKIDSGAALQLRRELHWFKEVEKLVQPSYRDMRNSEGKTPHILFTEQHRALVREGEKWMKDTASSCMVVATLIATVVFAAAFTVPGGNNNDTGRPIFLHHRSFMVFSVSNALALFSSASSILMFLSIITSRYAEEDFLHSLPNRLIIGLATLFISIVNMMVAFAASLFIVLGHDFVWLTIPIATVACVPVTLFGLLQFPLFADMIRHVLSSSLLFRPRNNLFTI